MTLGDGKRKVLMLLDEYSSGGALTVDSDINHKMADFFDMAQKDVAKIKPVYRQESFVLEQEDREQTVSLPGDCAAAFRLWKNGAVVPMPAVRGKFLVFPAGAAGDFVLEYKAVPKTIGAETPDEYVFEVDEAAADCMPFYVASMQLIPDLVVDYGGFWSIYQNMLAMLDTKEPSSGSIGVRQSFFAGRR